jgi:hypothetical protein
LCILQEAYRIPGEDPLVIDIRACEGQKMTPHGSGLRKSCATKTSLRRRVFSARRKISFLRSESPWASEADSQAARVVDHRHPDRRRGPESCSPCQPGAAHAIAMGWGRHLCRFCEELVGRWDNRRLGRCSHTGRSTTIGCSG